MKNKYYCRKMNKSYGFCSICQDDINTSQVTVKLDCGGLFHYSCINRLLECTLGKLKCLNCRNVTKDELVPFTPGPNLYFDINLDTIESDLTAAAVILSINEQKINKQYKRKEIKNMPLGNNCINYNLLLSCKTCHQKLNKLRFSNTQLKLNAKFGKKISCKNCYSHSTAESQSRVESSSQWNIMDL